MKILLWMGLPIWGVVSFILLMICAFNESGNGGFLCKFSLPINLLYLPLIWLYTETNSTDKFEGEEFFIIPLGILWTYILIKFIENILVWKRKYQSSNKTKTKK